MGNCPTCFNGSCPEVVPVTQNSYTLQLNSGDIVITVALAVPDDPTKRVVTLDAGVAGFYDFQCRFVDNPAIPGDVSLVPPSEEDAEFTKTTLADGTVQFDVVHLGTPVDTWYLAVELFGAVQVSAAISIGNTI